MTITVQRHVFHQLAQHWRDQPWCPRPCDDCTRLVDLLETTATQPADPITLV